MLPRIPVHTYSIVAQDPATGDMGIAVQSHWFCVGAAVIWAEAGVGVLAVQADADPAYGDRGLPQLAAGVGAAEVLATILREGPRPQTHQLAVLDPKGGIAAHTGASCIPVAGHRIGQSYSTQANMMLRAGVPEAMAKAFESATGPLPERLLAALDAAEAEGGDVRGKQSAALAMVPRKAAGNRGLDRPVDLRVDDHPTPLPELRRLLGLRRAADMANQGFEALGQLDGEEAAGCFERAAAMAPDQLEFAFWQAVAFIMFGRVSNAAELLASVFAREPHYATLLERLSSRAGRPIAEAVKASLSATGRWPKTMA